MSRYIDVDALQKQLCERYNEFMQAHFIDETYKKGYSNGYLEASILAENAPTADVVEVVRCRDCKYYRYYGKTSLIVYGKNVACGWCMRRTRQDEEYRMLPTDYCSYGKRKEQT